MQVDKGLDRTEIPLSHLPSYESRKKKKMKEKRKEEEGNAIPVTGRGGP
jgi:hypothetical protein